MKASKATRSRKSRPMTKGDMLKREKAIIADIKAGKLSYREIAAKHGVSLPTVNNKARKAGISRGRRKGAKIVVAAPARKTTARKKTAKKKAVRKAARKVGRPVKKATRKKAVRKVARKVGRPAVAEAPVRTKTGRKAVRRMGRRRVRSGFGSDLRELLLKYNPDISLRRYEKIAKLIQSAIR